MQYMDFSNLIRQHLTDFILITTSKDDWNTKGDFVKGEETRTTLNGAILAHRQNKVYRSEGTLTMQDRVLYMLTPLTDALKGAKILYKNKLYSVDSELENSEFTGVWSYNLKFLSAFKDGDANG